MSTEAISPLRQRMIEDMNSRRFMDSLLRPGAPQYHTENAAVRCGKTDRRMAEMGLGGVRRARRISRRNCAS